jgi:hypothetical protein
LSSTFVEKSSTEFEIQNKDYIKTETLNVATSRWNHNEASLTLSVQYDSDKIRSPLPMNVLIPRFMLIKMLRVLEAQDAKS